MRRNCTYLRACTTEAQTQPTTPPLWRWHRRAQHSAALAASDGTELATEAATQAYKSGDVDPALSAAVYHVTAHPPRRGATNLAQEIATRLQLSSDETQQAALFDGRAGIITAISMGARALATPTDGYPEVALITAGDANVHDRAPAPPRTAVGGALILSRWHGGLRLVSTVTVKDADLQYLRRTGAPHEAIRRSAVALVERAMAQAIREASPAHQVAARDITHLIAPASPDGVELEAFERLGGSTSAVIAPPDRGETSENVGAADLMLRLAPLLEPDVRLPPDAWVLVVAAGDGCGAAAALFRVA